MRRFPANSSRLAPAVSVIVAHYNSGGDILSAVESALVQEHVEVEVIVVDDASTDGSIQAIHALCENDDRVQIFRLSCNSGPGVARNRAISEARGKWLAILDADDSFLPGRLRSMLDVAEAFGADAVADNLCVADNQTLSRAFPSEWMQPSQPLTTVDLLRRDTPWEWPGLKIGYMKPIVSRTFLLEHGIRYDERHRISEDLLFYFDLIEAGARFVLSPICGYVSVVRPQSLSRGHIDIIERVRNVNHAILARLQGGPPDKIWAARRRDNALAFEIFITRLKSCDLLKAFAMLPDLHLGFVVKRASTVLRRRIFPPARNSPV